MRTADCGFSSATMGVASIRKYCNRVVMVTGDCRGCASVRTGLERDSKYGATQEPGRKWKYRFPLALLFGPPLRAAIFNGSLGSANGEVTMQRNLETRDRHMDDGARIRILCVDDHPLLRKGIGTMIANESDMLLVAEASNGRDAMEMFRKHKPDVTLMDLRLPRMSGIDIMIAIRAEFPEARIIILTTFEGDVEIQRALEAGARAYMLKTMPAEEMIEIIRHVHAGKKRVPPEIAAQLAEHYSDDALTEREIDVLRQIAGGNRNRDIADKLFISEHTVKIHIKHIMEKLGASDRTEAVAIGARRGIIQL